MKVLPNYFMVRINKEEQAAHKLKVNKDSPFFIPVGSVFNSRNMEHGEIVQIGEKMKDIMFWNARVGDTLIFHYSIEAPQEKSGKRFFLYEDEKYVYYAVDEANTRGYYDGVNLVPHPNFVFLKNIPAFPNMDEVDDITGNKVKKTEGGIFLVTSWDDSPQDIAQRSEKIKTRIDSLAKMKRTPEIQIKLEELQKERETLNRKAQKNEYLPYRVAAVNKKLIRDFGGGFKIEEDWILYVFNKAALYLTNFQLKEYKYIITPVDFVGGLLSQKIAA